MNIFDIYLEKIKKHIIKLKDKKLILLPSSLNGINVDVPPSNIDCDISTNVAMFLSKENHDTVIHINPSFIQIGQPKIKNARRI